MYKITDDAFNQALKSYPDCCIDYCIMKSEQPYKDFLSHREAVFFAISQFECQLTVEKNKATAVEIDPAEFLSVPTKPWKENRHGTVLYDNEVTNAKLSYWYAFLEPPHGTDPVRDETGRVIRKEYGIEDFHIVNHALFPNGADALTVYEWSTDWSDYFDDGHEWWGAACWSIYDHSLDRYVVVLASATD